MTVFTGWSKRRGAVTGVFPASVPEIYPGASLVLDFASARYRAGFPYLNKPAPSGLSGWSYSRTGTEYESTSSGLLVPFASGVPAITNLGLQVWEARTNLLLRSQALGTSPWVTSFGGTGSAPVVTNNFAVGPDGAATATRIQLNKGAGSTTADISEVVQSLTGLSNPHTGTASFWAKSNDASTYNVFIGPNVASTTATAITPTWQRFSVTETATATTTSDLEVFLRGTKGTSNTADILVWGYQYELASFAGPYIPTTSASATRGAASASVTYTPPAAGWIFAEWVQPAQTPTASNRVVGTRSVAEPGPIFLNGGSGIGTWNGTATLTQVATLTAGAVQRAVVTWDGAGRSVTANGLAPASDTNSFGSFTELAPGNSNTPSSTLDSAVRRVIAGVGRLSSAQMQALTQ